MSDPDQFIVISAEEAAGHPTVCRLCLEKSLDVTDIFNIERMSEKMHNFLQIEVCKQSEHLGLKKRIDTLF